MHRKEKNRYVAWDSTHRKYPKVYWTMKNFGLQKTVQVTRMLSTSKYVLSPCLLSLFKNLQTYCLPVSHKTRLSSAYHWFCVRRIYYPPKTGNKLHRYILTMISITFIIYRCISRQGLIRMVAFQEDKNEIKNKLQLQIYSIIVISECAFSIS